MTIKTDSNTATTHVVWVRQIVREFEGKLLRYAMRLLNNNLELARDVVQDTFLRLCKQERSAVEDHIAPWLYTVCRNRAFEVIRKEKRMTALEDVHLETTGADCPDPSARIQDDDDRVDLKRLIAELPPRQQELVRLRFLDGLSYKEISQVTELTVTNVGVVLHNAVKRIRKEMRNNAGLASS